MAKGCELAVDDNTHLVTDLDLGDEDAPDAALDLCAERDRLEDAEDIDTPKFTDLTLSLRFGADGRLATDDASNQGDKLEA